MNSSDFPFGVGIAQKPITNSFNVDNQLQMAADEAQKSIADRILPYSLEQITQSLGNVYVGLTQIKNFLDLAEQDPSVNKGNLKELHALIDDINTKIVIEIPQRLDFLTL